MGDLEKALMVAYSVATGKKKEKTKKELFHTLTLHARQMEASGNYLGAADKYRRAVEFAPSGNEAREILLHAVQILEQVAHQKAMQRKEKFAEKLLEKAEELRMLIPPAEEEEMLPTGLTAKATFSYNQIPGDITEKITSDLKSHGLIPANVDDVSRNGGMEIRIEASEGNIRAKLVLSERRALLSVEGDDAETALDYFLALKNSVLGLLKGPKMLEEEFEGRITPFMILKFLNDLKDRCRIRCPYKEIHTSLSSLVSLIKSDKALANKYKGTLKSLEGLIKKIHPDALADKIVSDEDLNSLISKINEGINKVKEVMEKGA